MNTYAKIGFLFKFARLGRHLSTVKENKPNFYELLGVSSNATTTDIKNAYYEKTKLYHPDVANTSEENLILFRQISEAYEVLGSPTLRKDYDENVLGISRDDAQDSNEDPIGSYRKQMYDKGMNSWIKEHCDDLRRQQYSQKSSSFSTSNPNSHSRRKSTMDYASLNAVCVVIFGVFLYYWLNKDSVENMKML